MSERIRLKNGKEFELKPLGFFKNDIMQTRQFKFVSGLPIGKVQALFKDADNIASIDHVMDNGTVRANYSDCAAYKSIAQDDTGIYTVELSTNTVEKELREMREKIAQLEAAQQPAPEHGPDPEEPIEEDPETDPIEPEA